MGTININVQTAPGSNLEETGRIMDEIEAAIRDIPQIKIYSRITGKDAVHNQSASAGSFTVRLKHWSERTKKGDDVNAVMNEIYRRTDGIKAASIRISTTPMISGYGMSNGFELYVQDKKGGNVEELLKYTNDFIDAMNKRPEISRAYTTFATKYPQFMVEVDAALCKRNGISPTDILSTLAGYVGGSYSSNLNRFTKLYRVMVQAAPEYRLDTEALNNIFVRNNTGGMSPISQYLTLTRVYGSESLSRFNLFSATASPAYRARLQFGTGHTSRQGSCPNHAARRLRIRVRRYVARRSIDRQYHDTSVHRLHRIHLPHPLRPLREPDDTVRCHPLCAIRTDGQFPLCQDVGTGKQYLYADRTYHAYRPACQDGHLAHGIRLRTPTPRHEHHHRRHIGCQSPPAPHPDDLNDNGLRHATADVLAGSGCQRQYFSRRGEQSAVCSWEQSDCCSWYPRYSLSSSICKNVSCPDVQ